MSVPGTVLNSLLPFSHLISKNLATWEISPDRAEENEKYKIDKLRHLFMCILLHVQVNKIDFNFPE